MAVPLEVLVVDDEANIRKLLSLSLNTDGHRVAAVGSAADALRVVGERSFDLAFVDLRLGADLGLELLPKLLAQQAGLKIVVITAYASIETAVDAIKRGATDYLPKPFTPAQVRLVTERVGRIRALEQQVAGLQDRLGDSEGQIALDSASPAMRNAINLARQVSASDASVLIRGESGTGKGIIARAIHAWSPRKQRPFATVSCPSLSAQLLESELFGHVKGSFTGAVRDKPGRIATSEGGTILLDEIGDLPLELQPKLLRFVQDREYERVGDAATRRADVRLLSATNVDLEHAVKAGKFREELLYRINVIQIDLPPLRERASDIPSLANRLLVQFARRRTIDGFSQEAMNVLRRYQWPGNVRELRNVIERAAILCNGTRIEAEHLPIGLAARSSEPSLGDPVPMEQIEAIHLRRLISHAGSLEEAATILQMDVATLWRKRKKYGI